MDEKSVKKAEIMENNDSLRKKKKTYLSDRRILVADVS